MYALGERNPDPIHNLRHYAASSWLRLGTPVREVAECLGDDPRTVLAVYAHVLGEDQRRAHADRLARAEDPDSPGAEDADPSLPQVPISSGDPGDPWRRFRPPQRHDTVLTDEKPD